MENVFHRCIETAENSPFNKLKSDTRTSNIFLWQNNLLKFYLENNIDKAIDYGHELNDEIGELLTPEESQDLKFSVATAHSLKCDDLDLAVDLYN